MNFEYGCQIKNKYNLFIDREDDGSEIVAESVTKASSKDQQAQKPSSAKTNTKSIAKSKDNKSNDKKPLQQADNSNKTSKVSDDKTKNSAKPQQQSQRQNQNRTQTPKEDKENNDKKQQGGFERREFRKPRGDGTTGNFNNDERRQDNPEGGFRPRRNIRPRRFEGGENQQEGGEQQQQQTNTEGTGYVRRSGGSGRGGFGGRGGRGGSFQRRRPQAEREFDRHSGSDRTGIKPVDKKDGAGKQNWGTVNDEIAAVEEPLEETQVEGTEEKKDWANRVDENEQKESEESKEVVPKLLTLDEYRALKNEINKKNQTQFNLRQAGEGEAPNKWNNLVLLKKKEDDEEEDDDDEEEAGEEEGEEEDEDEKKKLVNQIKIQFYEPSNKFSRGGANSNRGGPRDKPHRTGPPREKQANKAPRGSNQDKKSVPCIQDEQDFPSLSKD